MHGPKVRGILQAPAMLHPAKLSGPSPLPIDQVHPASGVLQELLRAEDTPLAAAETAGIDRMRYKVPCVLAHLDLK